MPLSFNADSLEILKQIAHHIALTLNQGDCITLSGDLGAGKTTFARFLIRHLTNTNEPIPSPTFNLVLTYPTTKGFTIWHFDWYRIEHANELDEIGWDDALTDGVSIVEWPEKAPERLPNNPIAITFAFKDETSRYITIDAPKHWDASLNELKNKTP